MAEALLRHELDRRGASGVRIRSAGTWGGRGHPATPEAVSVLRRRGIDLSEHASRELDVEELESADIVVVMTAVHEREVLGVAPHVRDKMVLLKELAEMHPAYNGVAQPRDRLRALLHAQRPPRRRSFDLDDPMGLPVSSYERCVGELEAGIQVLAEIVSS